MECNKSHIRYMISLLVFQFMHPLWDATLCQKKWSQSFWISIHASLMGCNRSITAVMLRTTDFNSCIPYGMQRTCNFIYKEQIVFQFMHPLWDATAGNCFRRRKDAISIHASLMGCNCKI